MFLLLIAAINILVLIDIYKMWRQVARGGAYEEQKVEDYLQNRGLLARLFRPIIRQVDASWKMYPVGVLFGLGFDTATEVGLLGIVATSGSTHLPVFFIMVFPLLFLAGMTVIDTTDSIMMLGAYGWAFVKPIRKLYYNLNITLISVLVALVIGALEALQVIGQELNLGGSFWNFIANHIDLNKMGFVIVGDLRTGVDHLHRNLPLERLRQHGSDPGLTNPSRHSDVITRSPWRGSQELSTLPGIVPHMARLR